MERETRRQYRFRRLAYGVCERLLAELRRVAFWSVVLLPVCYLVLLVTGAVTVTLDTLGTAVAVHAAALVVGHGHTEPGRAERT